MKYINISEGSISEFDGDVDNLLRIWYRKEKRFKIRIWNI